MTVTSFSKLLSHYCCYNFVKNHNDIVAVVEKKKEAAIKAATTLSSTLQNLTWVMMGIYYSDVEYTDNGIF